MSVGFQPLLPWWGIAALAVSAALLVALSAARRAPGTGWRVLALGVLLLALVDPRVSEAERQARPDVALVVVDRSASQQAGNRPARTLGALEALTAMAGAYDDLELRLVEAGTQGGGGTRLFAPLARALARIPEGRFAGAVMVTDGQVHDHPAGPLPGPMHVLLTGERDERDRRLVVETAPAFALVGKPVTLRYRVAQTAGEGAAAVVSVRLDGRDQEALRLRPGAVGRFTFTPGHAGPSVVELEADPLDGEASLANNRAAVTVQGVRDRLKVVLVSGLPHPGERVWRNLLKSDPLVDLVHFTILRPPNKPDPTPINELSLIPFPVDELFEKRLADFDLVVFDRYVVRGSLRPKYLDNIARFVEEGGALLVAAGPEAAGPRGLGATRLADLLPAEASGEVVEGAFRPRPTALGARHPVADLGTDPAAWGPWLRRIDADVARGDVVMEDDAGRPLLVLDERGKGRVALLLSDHLWLWARGYGGGGPHAELIRRLAHWLMREPELEAEALTARVRNGRLEIERRTVAAKAGPVTVTGPDGATRQVPLAAAGHGRWRASLPVGAVGLWRVEDGDRTALASAPPPDPLEAADTVATADKLAPVATSVTWMADGLPTLRRVEPGRPAAGRGWIGLVRNRAEAVTGLAERPLVPAPLLFAAALALLLMAWWREAR